MTIHEPSELTSDPALRDRAVKRLKKRRDFYGHLVAYVTVNSCLILIWAVTDLHGFFWPMFPLAAWGVGVVMNAWDVWRSDELPEGRIEREMRRISTGH